MLSDDVRGEDYEAARPVPARSRVTGDPWVRDHLPECDYPNALGCICPELRACEERVRDEYVPEVGRGWGEYLAYKTGIDNGYAAGVQAAREAVAALPQEVRSFDITSIDRDNALAAIDALRGES